MGRRRYPQGLKPYRRALFGTAEAVPSRNSFMRWLAVATSVDHPTEGGQRLAGQRIPRLDVQRFLEAAHRLAVHFSAEIGAAQIVVRKMARFVAPRFHGAFEPRDRFIEAAKLDEIGADVVVRIAEFRIELDRALAFRDSVLDAPLVMISPAQESMSFGGGMQLQ